MVGAIGAEGHRVRYVRIYADGGVSRFEDLEYSLLTVEGPPPAAPPMDLSAVIAGQGVFFGHMPKGWRDVEHPPPARMLFFFLSGVLDVTAGEVTRRFGAGDVVLAEDTDGSGHSAYVVEDVVWAAVLV